MKITALPRSPSSSTVAVPGRHAALRSIPSYSSLRAPQSLCDLSQELFGHNFEFESANLQRYRLQHPGKNLSRPILMNDAPAFQ